MKQNVEGQNKKKIKKRIKNNNQKNEDRSYLI
jgi:hypothetical protein